MKTDHNQKRSNNLIAFIGIGFLVLVAVIFKIQILDTSFQQKANSTFLDKTIIHPSRGLMFDRKGNLLVYNSFEYDIYLTYNKLKKNMNKELLLELLNIDDSIYVKRTEKDWSQPRYSKDVPFLFYKHVPDSICARFRERLFEFPGFSIRKIQRRGYTMKSSGHVFGYLSEVDNKDIENAPGKYVKGEFKGTSGVEAYYDDFLRGKKGLKYELRDNLGRKVGAYLDGIRDVETEMGYDLVLGLDIELQTMAEELLTNKKGAIVAIEPKTGEILCMASAPSFNPNEMVSGETRTKAYSRLSTDTLRPLFDRANVAHYPPGSVFKTVLGLIAMQEEVLTPQRTISCRGGYFYKGNKWGCHAKPGTRGVERAISESCNTFFFTIYVNLVEKYGYTKPELGLDKVAQYLNEFGFGHKLGVDLPQEGKGLNPDADFYNGRYPNDKWRSTYILSNAIGQGEVEITTLQMANLAAILANRGYYIPPHLIKYIKRKPTIEQRFKEKITPNVDRKYYDYIVDGMEQAVNEGTARSAYVAGLDICGKTGTSQNSTGGKDHSVFFAFAPKENPQIAIAVYIENGGWGGSYAAPMSGLLVEKYLRDTLSLSRMQQVEYYKNIKLLDQ